MTQIDERIVTDFMAGTPVPEIATRHGVSEDFVDGVIGQATFDEGPAVSRWSLSYTGNRVLLAVALGLLAFVTTRSLFGTIAVALIAFVVATIFFKPRR
jgi:hypothetical protein